MTFLYSFAIHDMLHGVEETVDDVEARGEPYLTSSLCVYEVIEGRFGASSTDVQAAR